MTTRLFVAVWPDDAARDSLADAVDAARRDTSEVRWQPPERWHITLTFLGATDPSKASRRIATLMGRDPTIAPAPVRLAGSGAFGPVVWVGVEHGPWMTALATDLQRCLRATDGRFRAHVTVARARGPEAHTRARAAIPTLAAYRGPCWTPDNVTLVESRTGPDPQYTVLEAWPLQDYREVP